MNLTISTAPHIRCKDSVKTIMRDVLIALLPTTAAGIYLFGLNSALIVAVSVASAVLAEFVWQKLAKRPVRVKDLSAAVTGLIFALNLPPTAPWWMAMIGSAFAIIVVKQLFGGIGDNFLNPALAARALLLASWPARMTQFVLPAYFSGADAVTSATVLSESGLQTTYLDMFLGRIPGTIGEVCKVAILIGFAYLLIRRVISWQVPVIILAVVALLSWIFGSDPLTAILSGGVMFGAVFMATDYTTSPMTAKGQIIFAVGIGVIIVLIRKFGSYPEGVTYAILFMNIVTPLIDKYVAPRLYGEVKKHA